jgi:type I restriction enzyme, S subunit
MNYKSYDEIKQGRADWMPQLPAHWDNLLGRRVFGNRRDKPLPEEPQLAATQKYGVLPQVEFMRREGQKVALALKGVDGFRRVEQGDFVISLRSFEGGIEYSPYSGCVSPAYTVLNPKVELESSFYRYLLKSSPYIAALQATTDSLRDGKSITYEQFGAIPLPLPSPDEQTTIANFLDRETAKIDTLIDKQEQLIKLLEEKRQAVISHAVTKGLNPDVRMKDSGVEWLGEVPEHWNVISLKHLVSSSHGIQMGPFGGMLKDLELEETGYKLYGQENTISGDFGKGGRWLASERYIELSNYQLVEGDIVLTRKGSLGKARLITDLPYSGIIDSDTIRIRVNSRRLSRHFLAVLMHEAQYISEQIYRTRRGSVLAGLNSETIANIKIILPSTTGEQEILVATVRDSQSRYSGAIEMSYEAIRLLKERRTALISAAVTGEIDVREAV